MPSSGIQNLGTFAFGRLLPEIVIIAMQLVAKKVNLNQCVGQHINSVTDNSEGVETK